MTGHKMQYMTTYLYFSCITSDGVFLAMLHGSGNNVCSTEQQTTQDVDSCVLVSRLHSI